MIHNERATRRSRGLDAWKAESNESFCHWDRWFLVVLVADHGRDWERFRASLGERAGLHAFERDDAEAKLSHLEDLERRVVRSGLSPEQLLGPECHDRRLLKTARARVIAREVAEPDQTEPMRETPRRRLTERARRGHWSGFPVSPARFESIFRVVAAARDHYDKRSALGLARRLESALRRQAKLGAGDPPRRLALFRAFLTAMLDTLDRADDSFGALGDLFQQRLAEYFAVPWKETGIAAETYYGDFLEFAVWEDYGLTWRRLGPFFQGVDPERVELADAILRELRAELLGFGLDHEAESALTLLGELHVAQRSFERFVELAGARGSRHWERITTMAEAAWEAGRAEVAVAVFAAADQPGMHREYLRQRCLELTGVSTAPRAPRLSIVR